MTIAMVYFEEAEKRDDYHGPLKRTMNFLGNFNDDLHAAYSPDENSAEADTFRSTYMIAAFSYGMNEDLRSRFRELGFPVNDAIFTRLMGLTSSHPGIIPRRGNSSEIRNRDGNILVPCTNPGSILFYSVTGKQYRVSEKTSLKHTGENILLHTTGLSPGIYILSLNNKRESITKVIVY
jgi:hypothetical protein